MTTFEVFKLQVSKLNISKSFTGSENSDHSPSRILANQLELDFVDTDLDNLELDQFKAELDQSQTEFDQS